MTALKFVDGSETAIEGLLLPFGGPAYLGGKDLSREYFTKRTDFCLDWYPTGVRPVLYHHGLDKAVKVTPVGYMTGITMKDDGGWLQGQLDASNAYFAEVSKLIKAGKVGLSSGAMGHLVESEPSGEIRRWPVVEGSITPTPANPLAVLDFKAMAKHYKSADIPIPDQLKAAMTAKETDALNDSDFAYIDADGGRHLPIHDAAHVRAAMSRFDQEKSFAAAKDPKAARQGAARKILAAAKRLDIEVSPDSAVSEAAGTAAKALSESGDSSGGFVADGESAADRSQYAGQAHTETRNHTHAHADGTEHQHAHRHDADDPSHDTSTHPHAVGMPMPTKAAPAPDALDTERSFEDIRDDICGLLNPVGPVPTNAYTCVVATFPSYVIACRHEYDDDNDDTYWRIAYTLNADLEPVLGDAVQVDQVWVPRAAKAAATPLTLNAISASRQAAALAHEAKALGERRASDYRPLSAPNYQAIASAKAGLLAAAEQCAAVLATSDERQQQQAKAAALESAEGLEVRLAVLRLTAGLLSSPAA